MPAGSASSDEAGCAEPHMGPGICVKSSASDCYSDFDCQPGQICQFDDAVNCTCSDGDEGACDCATIAVLVGSCVDDPGPGCYSDSDCEEGQHCAYTTPDPCFCPDDADCLCAPQMGTCMENIAGECSTNTDCGPGYECTTVCAPCACMDGEDCDCACFNTCEPIAATCWGQDDCDDGQECQFAPSPEPMEDCICDGEGNCSCSSISPPEAGICVDVDVPMHYAN